MLVGNIFHVQFSFSIEYMAFGRCFICCHFAYFTNLMKLMYISREQESKIKFNKLHIRGTWWGLIFKWFEEGCAILARLKKATQIKATQIKAPKGRVDEKYVCTCLMVKMRMFCHFGSFGSIWVGDSASGRILGMLNFGVLQVKKFIFRSAEICMDMYGYGCRSGSISEKVQIFGEISIWMKYILLYWGLSGSVQKRIF